MTGKLDDTELRDELSAIKNMMAELLARIDPPEESWPVKRVAKCLECSVRTAQRRIRDDPLFPAQLKSSKYNDRGTYRNTQPRWDPEEIRRYKKLS